MKLTFHGDYTKLTDRQVVDKIITPPYNEEAAAYLLYERHSGLIFKKYCEVFFNDHSWFEDCQNELFEYLKCGEEPWHKLRGFQWRSKLTTWLGETAFNRFTDIKPRLIGKLKNTVSIDDDGEGKTPVQLPDNGAEHYENMEEKILLMEAIGQLKDPDQKFCMLKKLEGYKSKDIAILLQKRWDKHGIIKMDKGKRVIPSEGYVNVRIQRATEILRPTFVNK